MKETIYTQEEVIEVLAELAGFKVTRVLKGYRIEPLDEDLNEFLQTENSGKAFARDLLGHTMSDEDLAIEAAENGYKPYVGDDF